jgi:predicted enzyme related to lactoylglutathione lyase
MSDLLMTFAFTKLVVDDLELTARFYEDVFALTRLQRVCASIAGSPIEEIVLGSDGGMGPVLLKWLDKPDSPRGEVILGVTTTDIHSLFERAKAAGGHVYVVPAVSPEAGGLIVGFLEDPEGHLIEVIESGH